jgi:DNA-binding NarL/FixJ family response regulator
MKTILFIEDEAMLNDAVKAYFEVIPETNLIYHKYLNKAWDQILDFSKNKTKIDLLICDLRFPKISSNSKFVSGDRLIKSFMEIFPKVPICIVSSNEMPAVISYNASCFKPIGYLLKSETDGDIFIEAVNKIFKGEKYYTETILKNIGEAYVNNISFDETDKQIFTKMSEGLLIKQMVGHIFNTKKEVLKLRRIEEIISDLRLALGAKTNEELIFKACKLGIIDCCS